MKHLNSGSASRIYCLKQGEKQYAMKMLNQGNKLIHQEIEILQQLQFSPQFPKLVSFNLEQGQMVMEKLHIDLLDHVQSQMLELGTILNYFKQMLIGLNQLHDLNIAHRDIKLENFMLTDDLKQIKFIDFGISVDLKRSNFSFRKAGCDIYIAPELNYQDKYIENQKLFKCDIYSLGVTLFSMIYRTQPYNNQKDCPLWQSIERGQWDKFWRYFDKIRQVPQELKNIMQSMMQPNPDSRIALKDLNLAFQGLNY
ncbi:hypothetical protein pb186bvf_007784 [Paramecium bursaria]